jgi:hypothetical protein
MELPTQCVNRSTGPNARAAATQASTDAAEIAAISHGRSLPRLPA